MNTLGRCSCNYGNDVHIPFSYGHIDFRKFWMIQITDEGSKITKA